MAQIGIGANSGGTETGTERNPEPLREKVKCHFLLLAICIRHGQAKSIEPKRLVRLDDAVGNVLDIRALGHGFGAED